MPMPQDDLTIMRLAQPGYPIIVSPIPPSCHPLFAPAILPAFAAAAISADFEVGWIDFDWCALGNLWNDVNAGKGSVPAFVGIERGDANKAMHSTFGI